MKGPLDNARLLMEHSEEDLIAAEAILATGLALRQCCFHAQQAVEMDLKALLAMADVDYPLTHNLGALLPLVEVDHPRLTVWAEEIVSLTPFAVEGRYIGLQKPDRDWAAAAFATARRVHGYVSGVLEAACGSAEERTQEGANDDEGK